MANRTFEHEWAYSALKHIARTHVKESFMPKLCVLPRFAVAADKAKLYNESHGKPKEVDKTPKKIL